MLRLRVANTDVIKTHREKRNNTDRVTACVLDKYLNKTITTSKLCLEFLSNVDFMTTTMTTLATLAT